MNANTNAYKLTFTKKKTGFYAIDSTMGCKPDASGKWVCDTRECVQCPDGVTCARGSSPEWKHFQPKALMLGETIESNPIVLPQITIEIPGEQDIWTKEGNVYSKTRGRLNPTHLYCQENKRRAPECMPAEGPQNETAPTGEYLWRYNRTLNFFVLIKCPHGHQLINGAEISTAPELTALDAARALLQKCKPCGKTFYIIPGESQLSKCKPCPAPQGKVCPDGAMFIPTPAGSQWTLETSTTGGLEKRLDLCPAGYSIMRLPPGNPPELDTCEKCENGKYLLHKVKYQGDRGNASAVGYSECRKCPENADCPGGNVVEAKSGYWRLQLRYINSSLAPAGYHGFEYIPEKKCNETGKT